MAFTQEIDTSLVNNEEVLNTPVQKPDSSKIDTLAIPVSYTHLTLPTNREV